MEPCLQAYVGWLFSFAVTRWGLHGHPLRARTLHVSPYLQCRPWRLQLRVHAEDFGFGNPPGDRRRPNRTCNPMHRGLQSHASQPAAPRVPRCSPVCGRLPATKPHPHPNPTPGYPHLPSP